MHRTPWRILLQKQCYSNWNMPTNNLKYVSEIHLKYFVLCCLDKKYFVFCYLDKSNLYFVFETQLECILCTNWNIFLCKILQVTENNTSAGCIQFSFVLGMFQPIFSVFLFIFHTLNCHSHSANTKPRNMFMLLLFIKLIIIDWLTRNDSRMYFVFKLLSLKLLQVGLFCILG